MLHLSVLIAGIIKKSISSDAWLWLKSKADEVKGQADAQALNTTFTAIPRKVGKQTLIVCPEETEAIHKQRKGFFIANWTMDRLIRVWLLMNVKAEDPESYKTQIEALFTSAEMNELVALYSALPVLKYPEVWRERCSEGIRSNIETVLQTIICNNPYPSEQLNEPAWNQLVLKAFFTNQEINSIIGLDERANQKLADTLIDFAREREAAGRTIPLPLWRCVGPFINEFNFIAIEKLIKSEDKKEQKAAALACSMSKYEPAKSLLNQYQDYENEIKAGICNWNSLTKD